MGDPRDDCVLDQRALLERFGEVREAVDELEETSRRIVAMLEGGRPVAETITAAGALHVRAHANAALDALERHRHGARLSLIAAGLQEGMTVGEIGRAFGFSRQLAGRHAKEARARGGRAAAADG